MAKGRKRLIAGWTLFAVAGVMTAGVVASRWWEFSWRRVSARGDRVVSLNAGLFLVSRIDAPFLESHWPAQDRGLMLRRKDYAERLTIAFSSGWSFAARDDIYWYETPVASLRGGSQPMGREVWWTLCVACWFVPIMVAAGGYFPLISGIRARRRTRVGLCPVCGYDLSATPTPNFPTCPECGKAR